MPEAKKKRKQRRRWDDPEEPKAPIITLPPGLYRLKCELDNPRPNRRYTTFKRWHDLDGWPKGMLFFVVEDTILMPFDDLPEIRLTTPQMQNRLPLKDARAQSVLAHLEPVEETPSDWLNRAALGANVAPDILNVLVSEGRLALADIQAVYEAHFSNRKGAGR